MTDFSYGLASLVVTSWFMTWVKICGMTNLEDALVAVEAGADAVGFVFYEKSPRCVTAETAREIVEKLPKSLEKVGVFVLGDGVNPLKGLMDIGLTGMQIYPPVEDRKQHSGYFEGISFGGLPHRLRHARSLMPLPMHLICEDEEQIRQLGSDFAGLSRKVEGPLGGREMAAILLDSGDLRRPGGTGRTFDWKKAVPIAEGMRQGGVKLVVAGGLTPENVGEAIGILQPWGVDVVSGVEAGPGKKDPEKVRAFVRAVRETDRKT